MLQSNLVHVYMVAQQCRYLGAPKDMHASSQCYTALEQ